MIHVILHVCLLIALLIVGDIFSIQIMLQCIDAIGWVRGMASLPLKILASISITMKGATG